MSKMRTRSVDSVQDFKIRGLHEVVDKEVQIQVRQLYRERTGHSLSQGNESGQCILLLVSLAKYGKCAFIVFHAEPDTLYLFNLEARKEFFQTLTVLRALVQQTDKGVVLTLFDMPVLSGVSFCKESSMFRWGLMFLLWFDKHSEVHKKPYLNSKAFHFRMQSKSN